MKRAIGAYAFAVWPATEGHRIEMVNKSSRLLWPNPLGQNFVIEKSAG